MKQYTLNLCFSLLFLTTAVTSCQNKEQNTAPKDQKAIEEFKKKYPVFKWEENICGPTEYPAEVYRGGLETRNINGDVLSSTGLNMTLATGPWGSSGGGASSGKKYVPNHINCIWLSYGEDTFYKIDCPIDYDKAVALFREGYPNSLAFFNYNEHLKDHYDTIITGFAPGGVVVIWLYGGGRQVEIGRYQGTKYTVPEDEIAGLELPTKNLFDPSYHKFILTNKSVVPLAVQEANKNKPIPYGLWDSYRTRYSWRPSFNLKEGVVVDDFNIEAYNGEKEQLFDERLAKNEFVKRAVPSGISFSWKDKAGQEYFANIDFDEQEVFKAFHEMYKNDPTLEAELECYISYDNDVAIWLVKGDKRLSLNLGKNIKRDIHKVIHD
jgi:hypothetical protein